MTPIDKLLIFGWSLTLTASGGYVVARASRKDAA